MAVTVDTTAAEALIRERFGQLADDGLQALLLDIEADAPRGDGTMVNTITVDANDDGTTVSRTIRAPQPYSSYQDEGVEGPIYPTTAKALHFFLKDGTEIFVKSTKGVPRTGWWSDKVVNLGQYLADAMR